VGGKKGCATKQSWKRGIKNGSNAVCYKPVVGVGAWEPGRTGVKVQGACKESVKSRTGKFFVGLENPERGSKGLRYILIFGRILVYLLGKGGGLMVQNIG